MNVVLTKPLNQEYFFKETLKKKSHNRDVSKRVVTNKRKIKSINYSFKFHREIYVCIFKSKRLANQTWCRIFACVSITPLGFPVVPLVYINVATSLALMASYVYCFPEIILFNKNAQ